ncbi:hypothetical protein TNCV_640871 [Trichonephila clavipes]|nr:hypothetical protein TNCV_640871 [Trichonephila clavipes]
MTTVDFLHHESPRIGPGSSPQPWVQKVSDKSTTPPNRQSKEVVFVNLSGRDSLVVYVSDSGCLYAKPVQSVYITPILQRHRRSSSFLPFHPDIGPPSFRALFPFSRSRALFPSSLDPGQGSSPVS